jgi:hypothetical protein
MDGTVASCISEVYRILMLLWVPSCSCSYADCGVRNRTNVVHPKSISPLTNRMSVFLRHPRLSTTRDLHAASSGSKFLKKIAYTVDPVCLRPSDCPPSEGRRTRTHLVLGLGFVSCSYEADKAIDRLEMRHFDPDSTSIRLVPRRCRWPAGHMAMPVPYYIVWTRFSAAAWMWNSVSLQ